MDRIRVVITGMPGTGKTTLIKRLVELLRKKGMRVAGFYTKEIREGGQRTGFRVVDINTKKSFVLASTKMGSGTTVGRYRVDVSRFDEYVGSLYQSIESSEIIIIDELGPMEFKSKRFSDLVFKLAEHGKSWVVTTHYHAKNEAINRIEQISKIFVLRRDNRELVLRDVVRLFRADQVGALRSQEN